MEVKYRPPLDDEDECNFLENNFKKCLAEKQLKDDVPKMKCKPEQIIWFFLECPTKNVLYTDKNSLRKLFIQEKLKATDPNQAILKK